VVVCHAVKTEYLEDEQAVSWLTHWCVTSHHKGQCLILGQSVWQWDRFLSEYFGFCYQNCSINFLGLFIFHWHYIVLADDGIVKIMSGMWPSVTRYLCTNVSEKLGAVRVIGLRMEATAYSEMPVPVYQAGLWGQNQSRRVRVRRNFGGVGVSKSVPTPTLKSV
jgi:hypothetical protein